ncbi:zinc ribbon domain-containing protein [Companilactobacillus halodurans]|uniref:Zinc-ribbon domain-containing protein n=1 Tax=Companilactobacillus halodurans TaxID=2584183 RepID=A0A5P0ZX40_9LACO|nr:zinc ribbon domain-containing protein [Companilactobacillus halodurans]MQS76232.1 hypothetical protein [Companilactobacillus halodurans]MQS97372.1 hypothetical protein [Companilactobacillus halodurans]
MKTLEYCPNCGTHLDKENQGGFCPNCGFNLKKYLEENADETVEEPEPTPAPNNPEAEKKVEPKEQAAENVQETPQESQPVEQRQQASQPTQSTPPAPKRKKGHGKIIALIILIIILIGGYFVGNMYYSQARQTQSLQDEVTSGTTSKMKDALINEDGDQFSTDQIGALKRLYSKSSSAIKDIEAQISENQSNNTFYIKQSGKYFLLYPKYKVVMKTKTLNIDTNINNPTFSIDGKSVAARSANGEYRIDDMSAGVYDLKVSSNKKSNQTKSKQISISTDNEETDISMNVQKPKKSKKTTKKADSDNEKSSEDSDNDSDSDIDSNDDSDSDSDEDSDVDDSSDDTSDDSSDDSIVGQYSGDPDLSLYSDGTYDLGDQTGTYKIVENNDGHVKIQYNRDGGGSITESYDYSDGELHSSKYDQSWYKD